MNLEEIEKNGIVGAGGAGFPTHIKLSSRPEFLVLNAAECEPLLHKDMELLSLHMDQVVEGLRLAMDLTGARQGLIGIKKKHPEVIDRLNKKIDAQMRIAIIGDFYPAGDEVTLVYLTTGRTILPGSLPIRAGCIVQNVETLYNIALNRPVVDKFITVAGAVERPLTLNVPIGTSFAEILSKFNITARQYAVRSGGLMMGKLEEDQNQVVTKQIGGLIVLPTDHYCVTTYKRYSNTHQTIRIAKAGCDQCSFCTDLCPRYLLGYPVRPETAMRNRIFSGENNDAVFAGNAFCCECNLCTLYACPESLDPKGATVLEKQSAGQKGLKWEGLPVKHHPMMDYRRVPTKKLMQRLDVLKFKDEAPFADIKMEPIRVRLPLKQHVGVPAKPVVQAGQKVNRYDLIAEADGKPSANIHASITGTVMDVNPYDILIERQS